MQAMRINLPFNGPRGNVSDGRLKPTIRLDSGSGITSLLDDTNNKTAQKITTMPTASGNDLQSTLVARASQNHEDRRFWPELLIKELVTPEVIASTAGIPIARAYELVAQYQRIFAILSLSEKGADIEDFVRSGINDETLPLIMPTSKLVRESAPDLELLCFRSWRWHELDNFVRWQYEMKPAYFSFGDNRTVRYERFERRVVLPFTQKRSVPGGGYGEVFRVTIDASSHGYNNVLKSVCHN